METEKGKQKINEKCKMEKIKRKTPEKTEKLRTYKTITERILSEKI